MMRVTHQISDNLGQRSSSLNAHKRCFTCFSSTSKSEELKTGPKTASRPFLKPGLLAKLVTRHRTYIASTNRSDILPSNTGVPESMAIENKGPEHLVVFANGLFGSPANWNTILQQMRTRVDASKVLLYASQANKRTDTYDGIDVCGNRLADEIRTIVSRNPSLQRISVVGHSMGGLLLRYAVGVCYNPSNGKIAGLTPCHFLTLATPHLGCDADGVSQVPFIGWLGGLQPVQKVLNAVSVPIASVLFKRTGRQFFMADEDAGKLEGTAGLPLLARMTHDVPSRGEYFWSALCSFASRTAYANTGMDHLVGWANSSLRFMHQLPELPQQLTKQAKGVVLEDELLAAFDVRFKPQQEPQSALSSADLPVTGSGLTVLTAQQEQHHQQQAGASQRNSSDKGSTHEQSTSLSGADHMHDKSQALGTDNHEPGSRPPSRSHSRNEVSGALDVRVRPAMNDQDTGSAGHSESRGNSSSSSNGGNKSLSRSAASNVTSSSGQVVEDMLKRLQSLAWRRIDVCWDGAISPFAHNNIQVTRRWLNWEGDSVAAHVAEQFAASEEAYLALRESGSMAKLERRSASFDVPRPGAAQQSVGDDTAHAQLVMSVKSVRDVTQVDTAADSKL